MNKIEINEIIGCKTWLQLCDYDYDDIKDGKYPTGIICCHLDHIADFFKKIKGNKERYIVISPKSDFGLCYQNEFPVCEDMWKPLKLHNFDPRYGYSSLSLPPRCFLEDCNLKDFYSVKMYMYTGSTFNEIPKNVGHWYVTNNCIIESIVTSLPFGINNTGTNTAFFDYYRDVELKEKTKLCYVNFQFYTSQRVELTKYYSYDIRNTVKRDIPFEEYMDDLNDHKFCICPCGNGFDSYRIWEALYMGCIPVIEKHPAFRFIWQESNLPVLVVDNLYRATPGYLLQWYDEFSNKLDWFLNEARLSYYEDQINESARNWL